jgi:uncharacterized protein (DUF2141 family)
MKKLILLSILLVSPKIFAADINIDISNIKNNTGNLMIGLFNSKDTFLTNKYKGLKLKAQVGSIKAKFENIPNGTYAIALYHDENLNNKLDKNLFHIPKEGYGFSNNAKPFFGPPKFDKAQFKLDGNYHAQIKMKY